MSRLVSWLLLVVWSAWMFALQGMVAHGGALSAWTPDLGICLLLALDPRLERRDALLSVVIVSGARIGFSADPAIAVLVGYAAVVVCARKLRREVEVDRLLPRALVAAVGAAVLTGYWSLARNVALAHQGVPVAHEPLSWERLAKTAAATAVAAVTIGPLLVRLPGMSPLRRRSRR